MFITIKKNVKGPQQYMFNTHTQTHTHTSHLVAAVIVKVGILRLVQLS